MCYEFFLIVRLKNGFLYSNVMFLLNVDIDYYMNIKVLVFYIGGIYFWKN